MKVIAALVALTLLSCSFGAMASASRVVTITGDRGGSISEYIAKYKHWARDDTHVRIDGDCFSACTLFSGPLKRENVCVTKNAVLGYHGAFIISLFGTKVESDDGTAMMTKEYSADINAWLNARGGLRTFTTLYRMSFPETTKYFPLC